MKLLLKVVIFLAATQSQMALAELGKSKVVKGDSANLRRSTFSRKLKLIP